MVKSAIQAGFILLLVSVYPLALMIREGVLGRYAYSRYRLEAIATSEPGFTAESLDAEVAGHHVRLSDSLGRGAEHDARTVGRVEIEIDGRPYSSTNPVEIRPYFLDSNRYHGWVHLIKLVDTQTAHSWLSVAQRLAPPPVIGDLDAIPHKADLRYRLLLVGQDGSVTEDVFEYRHRGSPVTRKMLAAYVSPFGIGFHSDILQVWPTIFFPILYPLITGAVGIVLTIIGVVILMAGRTSPKVRSQT